ncbi:AAA family ATPase [Parapedobacter indicus]|uniref:Predicted ATP-dependent endonuclease of the OLD family, contains P-loop ATPase and TOPRIM domains n=1 Tax=Parapedobacter indicus TaxID=1477437 RepID=A0A1I3UL47_9SPHI|nr:AAA family ATPase [Parapedobacter indicus]PPK99316.1 putative ATP-dependent endonuclease of OLD family [Parapedobacter indicus]SFJ82556.1 Predicted ATP-dependent endonuclease of the OLD family, contains P-loop ATPase and TOPRIM domains [Parapedobacter indicus]
MKLYSLKISGYKRLKEIKVLFGDATFLIGQNNCGKSSVIKAVEILLSAKKQITSAEYHSIVDEETNEVKVDINTVLLEAEFRNLPKQSKTWRGFKGRIFEYDIPDGSEETGLSVIYRKTYELGKDVVIEFKSKVRTLKGEYANCKKPTDYIDKGLHQEIIEEYFPDLDSNIGKSKVALEKLELIDELWEISDEETWFQNPGGIPGNVLKMLPRFLLIPVDVGLHEIQGSGNGVLSTTLGELFHTVRESSDHFKNAQIHLNNLAKQLDPQDGDSEFGKMMTDLNNVLSTVFPESKLHATTSLSDPTNLKPTFNVEMSSNIKTAVADQGTGMIRAAVFGMLRYRQLWLSKREDEHARSLIICFEEPETYLHPSAANQMREAIYELSSHNSQIIASTHSPYIIDLSRKPKQVLNRLYNCGNHVECDTFNVSENFKALQADDKDYVKMILKIDSYIARIFFTKYVVIIEGDTEDILIKETLKKLSKAEYFKILSDFEIIKARGKAAIIGLVKYLTSMGIKPIVVHDSDAEEPNAAKYNQPIQDALDGNGRIVTMDNNVEEVLEYEANYEKPYQAFKKTIEWGDNWEEIPERWKIKMQEIFGEYI